MRGAVNMKKFFKVVVVVILLACILCGGMFVYKKFFSKEKGITISNWDSIYNENNIKFFYENLSSEKTESDLSKLDAEYKIKDSIKNLSTEKDIISKGMDILNSIADSDDISESNLTSGYAIISNMAGRKKLAPRDMAYLQRDIFLCEGIVSRVGEFRKEDPKNAKNPSYYIVEYWSTKYSKWVMIDVVNNGYLEKNDEPLSAIEIMQAKMNDLTYVGSIAQSDFKDKIKKYLSSYTIAIDNTLDNKKSNTYITYTTDKKDITLKVGNSYAPCTIYTTNKDLFNFDPSKKIDGKDAKAYLVIMKDTDEKAADNAYIIGAFKDDSILDEYYLKINDDNMEKVLKYKNIELEEGTTSISLLIDGQAVEAKVEIENNK